MTKGYLVVSVNITDPERYKLYAAAAKPAVEKYNGKYIVRGGDVIQLEGEACQRRVIVEFDSIETALACYNSEEYQAAKKHRDGACVANFALVEGFDD